jgi:Tol biopolymer transport system component/tRNA A-37 threonylcarbamoyl transferase component Bud32
MTAPERLATALADRYRLEHELGQGGMATVYLAEDLKHGRRVAIKVLHPELSAIIGGERFLAEIKVTANLQHPHILGLIDSGAADGLLYYVMPYVAGETLRGRLTREKQLPVDDAIRLTKEVAGALDYAHRQGVVHRDIKPENILLQDGSALVADFGIALAVQQAGGSRMTQTGMSLGTPAYMSPEQAMGEREIGARSDVYALGAMAYEMLAGEPPFTGPNSQAIMAKVLTEAPVSLRAKRPTAPLAAEAAILTALQKLPADRFATAAAFADALTNLSATLPMTSVLPSMRPISSTRWRWAALVAGAVALVSTSVALRAVRRTPDAPVTRVSIAFPKAERVRAVATRRFAISGDGSRIVYIGPDSLGSRLWVRDLNSLTARPLPGTENALAPFISPDGQSVGFFTGIPGDLRVVTVAGGPAVTLVRDSANPWGGDWAADGRIYYVSSSSQLARVAASGGAVELVSALDSARGETEHDWPQVLPGGRTALVQIWHSSIGDTEIGILDLETGRATPVIKDAIYGRYLPTGHILYSTLGGSLMAVAFDARRSTLTGAASAIVEGVQVDNLSGSAQFAVSDNGTMLYMPGGGSGSQQPAWVDRSGKMTPVDSAWRGNFTNIALSPDGARLAVSSPGNDGEQIWVKHLPAGPVSRLTFGGATNTRPSWARDGRQIAFVSSRSGKRNAWIQRADGSAEAESLLAHPAQVDEVAWTPDGRRAVVRYGSGGTGGNRNIFLLVPGDTAAPKALVAGRFEEFGADVSPDGRWFAYTSNESGRNEVYVRRLDDPGAGKTQVSIDGGAEVRWAHNGRELFFRSNRAEMMVAEVTIGESFSARPPRALFSTANMIQDLNHHAYDITADDQRFVMISNTLNDVGELVLVMNWFTELRARTAGQR